MLEFEVALMITMFIKLALCVCNFNVISNGATVQAHSPFDSVLKPMISDWKIRSANTEVQNDFNLIQMIDDGVFFNTCSGNFYKTHGKVSVVELRFWIVYCHAKFVLSNKWLLQVRCASLYLFVPSIARSTCSFFKRL